MPFKYTHTHSHRGSLREYLAAYEPVRKYCFVSNALGQPHIHCAMCVCSSYARVLKYLVQDPIKMYLMPIDVSADRLGHTQKCEHVHLPASSNSILETIKNAQIAHDSRNNPFLRIGWRYVDATGTSFSGFCTL